MPWSTSYDRVSTENESKVNAHTCMYTVQTYHRKKTYMYVCTVHYQRHCHMNISIRIPDFALTYFIHKHRKSEEISLIPKKCGEILIFPGKLHALYKWPCSTIDELSHTALACQPLLGYHIPPQLLKSAFFPRSWASWVCPRTRGFGSRAFNGPPPVPGFHTGFSVWGRGLEQNCCCRGHA